MPFTTIPSTSHRLHYTDYPPTDTKPKATLLFIHGLGSTQNYYLPIIPGLNQRGFRCVVFDSWLAGRSVPVDATGWTKAEEGGTSVAAIAKDGLGVLEAVGVGEGAKVVVVGYSMGGMVPTHMAATYPDRVLAGICIGPVHPTAAVADVFRQRVPVVQEGGIETMANTIPHRATGTATTPLQKSFIREMILSQDPRGYIANCRAIEHATPPEYTKVKCPLLIVAGSEDKSAPVEGCEVIAKGVREGGNGGVKLEILQGLGHWHCVERGEEVERVVGSWLEELLK